MASALYGQTQHGMQYPSPPSRLQRPGYHVPSPYPRSMQASRSGSAPYSPLPEESEYDDYYRQNALHSTPSRRPVCGWDNSFNVEAIHEQGFASSPNIFPQNSKYVGGFSRNSSLNSSYTRNQSFHMSESDDSSYETCPETPYNNNKSLNTRIKSANGSFSSGYTKRSYSEAFQSPYNGGQNSKINSNMEWQPQPPAFTPMEPASPVPLPPQPLVQTTTRGNFKKFPTKRKAEPQQLKHCDLCGIDFTSQIPYDMHLRGAKHMKKLKAEETLKMLQSQGYAKPTDIATKAFHCEVCDLTLNGALQLQTHYEGTKHKNKVAAAAAAVAATANETEVNAEVSHAEQNGKDSSKVGIPEKVISAPVADIISEPGPAKMAKFACEICSVTVNSQIQLQQHLESKKHQAKLEGKTYTRKKWKRNKVSDTVNQPTEQVDAEGGLPSDEPKPPQVTEVVHGVPPLSSTFVKSDVLN